MCEGLKSIFEHIGGVPKVNVFDNATGIGRRMIVEGQVSTIMAGKKYLVDLDRLLAYLDRKLDQEAAAHSHTSGVIRAIPERIRT